MSLQRFISNSAALLLWGIALVAAGCSEDVNPVVGIDYPYTLYGYMNPEADTQWVRVFPIGHTLEATDSGPLHARFKSINAMTGEAEVWEDSLFHFSDEVYGNIFWSPFRAENDHLYRIEVERLSDGAVTSVDVRTPPSLRIRALEADAVTPYILPVIFEGGMPEINRLEVEYWVQYYCADNNIRIPFDYLDDVKRDDGALLLEVDLTADFDRVVRELHNRSLFVSDYIHMYSLTVRIEVSGEALELPLEDIGPDLLSHPAAYSNVKNGFGYVGSGYVRSQNFFPRDISEVTGFAELPWICGP